MGVRTPAVNTLPVPIVCPVCGMENGADAVFCANPACHKALSEFRYALEEVRSHSRWHEKLADVITGFIGRPHFVAAHAVWFVLWVAVNTGVAGLMFRFDRYPFSLLGILLSMEAVFITSIVLISQNRQNVFSDKRAELDYEVNVRVYRRIHEMDAALKTIAERLDRLETTLDPDAGSGGG